MDNWLCASPVAFPVWCHLVVDYEISNAGRANISFSQSDFGFQKGRVFGVFGCIAGRDDYCLSLLVPGCFCCHDVVYLLKEPAQSSLKLSQNFKVSKAMIEFFGKLCGFSTIGLLGQISLLVDPQVFDLL